jgi:ribonuclease E
LYEQSRLKGIIMVEKKARTKKASSSEKAGDEKKETKASTGAWWKSTVSPEISSNPDATTSPDGSVAAGGEESGLPTESEIIRPQRGARKRSSGKRPTSSEKSESTGPEQESEKKPKRRPSRKRPSKKTDEELQGGLKDGSAAGAEMMVQVVSNAPPTLDQLDTVFSEQPATGTGVVVGGDEETEEARSGSADLTEASSLPPVVEGVEKKKSGRSRRGRRGSKKNDGPKVQPEEEETAGHLQDESEEEISEEKESGDATKPVLKLLINAEEPEECRLALLEDGRLESIYVSTVTRTHTKNNIYKARIVALEANLQAAFVDYGTEKNGFLPFGEIHPEYYRQNVNEKSRKLIEQNQWKKLSITDVLEKGQEVLVQVVKEEVGTKGANMTTYLSLPGRCVVLLPGSDSSGISRRFPARKDGPSFGRSWSRW